MLDRREAWCEGVLLAVLGLAGCASAPDDATLLASRSLVSSQAVPHRMDRAATWTRPVVLPLARADGYLLVPADINGESAGLMMIDTGASLSVVALGTAGRLQLATDGAGRTVGVGGVQDFQYLRAGSFVIGGREGLPGAEAGVPAASQSLSGGVGHASGGVGDGAIRDDRVQLSSTRLAGLELSNFGRALGVGLTGIVGFTDLSPVPFTIDAQAQTLTLHPPGGAASGGGFRPPRGAQRDRLTLFRRLPTVEAELDDGRQRIKVRLLIDYGADTALTLPTQLLEQYPGLVAVDASGVGSTQGIGGNVRSTQTWVRQVRLFGMNLQHIPVNFETPPPQLHQPQDALPMGRIGNSLLQHFRLTFHTSHGWLYTQWLPDAE